jgi:hypothetical protein
MYAPLGGDAVVQEIVICFVSTLEGELFVASESGE